MAQSEATAIRASVGRASGCKVPADEAHVREERGHRGERPGKHGLGRVHCRRKSECPSAATAQVHQHLGAAWCEVVRRSESQAQASAPYRSPRLRWPFGIASVPDKSRNTPAGFFGTLPVPHEGQAPTRGTLRRRRRQLPPRPASWRRGKRATSLPRQERRAPGRLFRRPGPGGMRAQRPAPRPRCSERCRSRGRRSAFLLRPRGEPSWRRRCLVLLGRILGLLRLGRAVGRRGARPSRSR